MDRQQFDGWIEKAILGVVLAILIFTSLATGAVRPLDFVVVQWLAVVLLLLWIGRLWVNPKHRLYWPPVCWGVVAFVGYALASYWTSELEYVARQELVRVLVYALLFLVIIQNLHRQENAQIITVILIFLSMAISVYAAYQFLTDSDKIWHFDKPEVYAKRGSGTFICPNHLAGYLEMILPLALTYTLTGRFKLLTKVFMGYASLVIFLGIAVTISRGGWASCGVTLVVLVIWLIRQRDYRMQGLILLACLVLVTSGFAIKARISTNRYERLSLASQIEDPRYLIWKPALNIWLDHPWWGVGPDHFDNYYRQYRLPHRDAQSKPNRVHNDYLNTLVDWGLAGFLILAATWAAFFWLIKRSWPHLQREQNDLAAKRSHRSTFVMGAALGLISILIHSSIDFNMHIPANAILAVVLMALVTGFFRYGSEQYWITLRIWRRLALSLALVVVGVGLIQWNTARTKEVFWLARAKEMEPGTGNQVEAYKKALAAEPGNYEIPFIIGEIYRLRSWKGLSDYKELAQEAMIWFEKSMALNPLDPYGAAKYGMCLDWLGKHEEADTYFDRAHQLDPNGYYITALVGWHLMQKEAYLEAKAWFDRSIELFSNNNFVAWFYRERVKEELERDP